MTGACPCLQEVKGHFYTLPFITWYWQMLYLTQSLRSETTFSKWTSASWRWQTCKMASWRICGCLRRQYWSFRATTCARWAQENRGRSRSCVALFCIFLGETFGCLSLYSFAHLPSFWNKASSLSCRKTLSRISGTISKLRVDGTAWLPWTSLSPASFFSFRSSLISQVHQTWAYVLHQSERREEILAPGTSSYLPYMRPHSEQLRGGNVCASNWGENQQTPKWCERAERHSLLQLQAIDGFGDPERYLFSYSQVSFTVFDNFNAFLVGRLLQSEDSDFLVLAFDRRCQHGDCCFCTANSNWSSLIWVWRLTFSLVLSMICNCCVLIVAAESWIFQAMPWLQLERADQVLHRQTLDSLQYSKWHYWNH